LNFATFSDDSSQVNYSLKIPDFNEHKFKQKETIFFINYFNLKTGVSVYILLYIFFFFAMFVTLIHTSRYQQSDPRDV